MTANEALTKYHELETAVLQAEGELSLHRPTLRDNGSGVWALRQRLSDLRAELTAVRAQLVEVPEFNGLEWLYGG